MPNTNRCFYSSSSFFFFFFWTQLGPSPPVQQLEAQDTSGLHKAKTAVRSVHIFLPWGEICYFSLNSLPHYTLQPFLKPNPNHLHSLLVYKSIYIKTKPTRGHSWQGTLKTQLPKRFKVSVTENQVFNMVGFIRMWIIPQIHKENFSLLSALTLKGTLTKGRNNSK